MPDIANFIAQNSPRFNRAAIDREHYGNALARNQVQRIPQQNRAQDLAIQGQELDISNAQRQNAAGVLGRNFSIIANSPRPRDAARAFIGSADFQTAGKLAGLPVERFSITDADTDEVVRQQAYAWATALEANTGAQSTGRPGSLQELDEINADRASRGEQPMRPEEYLAQRRGSSADSQLYAQYVQGLPPNVRPLPMDQFLIQFRGGVAGSQTRAEQTTKIQTEAQADLPRVEQNATQVNSAIDQLLAHPGFNAIFGASSIFQPGRVPGTEAADAQALLNQVKGKTFLEAFQTLKGGGAITEMEGAKAEQAIARLNQAQTERAAREALQELKQIAANGVQRARQKAGQTQQPNALPDLSKMTDEQLMQIINGQ